MANTKETERAFNAAIASDVVPQELLLAGNTAPTKHGTPSISKEAGSPVAPAGLEAVRARRKLLLQPYATVLLKIFFACFRGELGARGHEAKRN